MDVAIRLDSINLGNGRVMFKPIGLIKGVYDEIDDDFIDEYGYVFDPIVEYDNYNDNYFCNPVSLAKLQESSDLDEEEILEKILIEALNIYYISYYDFESNNINIFELNFSKLEKNLVDQQIDSNVLNSLKQCNSIEDVKKIIDNILNTQNKIIPFENKEELFKPQQDKKNFSLKKEESTKFNLVKLRKEVLANIIGQDEAVKDITRVIAINQTSKNPKNKSHILVTGPSGTGKTEIVNIIAKELNLPIFKADATAYTKEGYVGKSVYSMLNGLLEAANNDIDKAQNGILIIDEIDKKSSNGIEDVAGKSVLHSMLKILDRDLIEIDLDEGEYAQDKMIFDTSNLTIILMGSFDELYAEKKKYIKNSIGFNKEKNDEVSNIRIDEEDLVKWLGSEFVGRIGSITCTKELKIQDVLKILKESKISQLKIAKQDLADRGIKLIYTKGYLQEIAKKGLSDKLGVRKLNKTVKSSLVYAYDEILENSNYKTLKLTKATALDSRKYFLE